MTRPVISLYFSEENGTLSELLRKLLRKAWRRFHYRKNKLLFSKNKFPFSEKQTPIFKEQTPIFKKQTAIFRKQTPIFCVSGCSFEASVTSNTSFEGFWEKKN